MWAARELVDGQLRPPVLNHGHPLGGIVECSPLTADQPTQRLYCDADPRPDSALVPNAGDHAVEKQNKKVAGLGTG